MKLINLDNLVLIGPGSEWFWSAVSAIVVAVTFLAIYRQLRLQRSAAAIEQIDSILREWTSERMMRAWLDVLHAVKAGIDPSAFPTNSTSEVADFWEKVGYLAHMGHIDRKIVHGHLSPAIERAWAWMQPAVFAARDVEWPQLWSEFEWLAHTMADFDAKSGINHGNVEEWTSATLKWIIPRVSEALAAEEALRTVPVRIVEMSRAGS